MQSLTNKRILLGITGGIAAYKAAELVRQFKTHNADVRVVMTQAAQEFITPLTLQALSGNPVHVSLLDHEAEAGMGHIELAKWADVILVAPASADFIARLSQGMGNDLLTTLCLATDAPLALAPAMNQAMWRDDATQQNITTLAGMRNKRIHWFGPGSGDQACGDVGPGRMLEPVELAQLTSELFETGQLAGRHVVITAGPTREALDPVRFISNHSSGKMGFALAESARDAGAKVTLICGPIQLPTPDRVTRVDVESAEEMLSACLSVTDDIIIGAAAIADYRPVAIAEQKIKKSDDHITLELVKNPDVLATVVKQNKPKVAVGFAAETQDVKDHAKKKLVNKGLDLIVANDVSEEGIGFNSDNNAAWLISNDNEIEIPTTSKLKMAQQIIQQISELNQSISDD